jgi:phage regulator Rha-like protein
MKDLTLSSQELTMSSREIAELTGKAHRNVKRDIKVILEELNLDVLKFERTYIDASNRKQTEYRLDRELSLTLVSGYNIKLRNAIVKRWQELENQQAPAIPQTFAEALQLAADQAKQLELQAPKVAFVENLVERGTLLTATQVGQKHGLSAIKLNRFLDELGCVYSKGVKRSRVFLQAWIDKGYGEMKQTETGHDQALFTPAGEVRIHELMISEGLI